MLELPASRNNLAIEFAGLQFASEDALTYQYRLEGVEADWGAPGKARAVNYARLAPGAYRFQARAITREGRLSEVPVTFTFRILSPLYLRWWFLALTGLTIGLAAYGFYRYRLARLVELERVRTRIATDLHDDIGASLSRVAILSEVVKRQVGGQAAPLLTEIADSARGLVESMINGTHLGEYGGAPASGNRVAFELAAFFLFGSGENAGKIVCERAYFDNEILMRQIRGEADAATVISLAGISRAAISSGS